MTLEMLNFSPFPYILMLVSKNLVVLQFWNWFWRSKSDLRKKVAILILVLQEKTNLVTQAKKMKNLNTKYYVVTGGASGLVKQKNYILIPCREKRQQSKLSRLAVTSCCLIWMKKLANKFNKNLKKYVPIVPSLSSATFWMKHKWSKHCKMQTPNLNWNVVVWWIGIYNFKFI